MRVYYENAKGEQVRLDRFPLMIQEPETLLASEWQYTSVTDHRYRNTISGFYKGIAEKQANVSVFADSKEEYAQVMDNFLSVTEYDVLNVTPGRLYVNDYYISCFAKARSYSEYEEDFYATESTITFLTPNPMWIKERSYRFSQEDATSTDNKRYGHKYPYRYANGLKDLFVVNEYIQDCDFEMSIFGPVLNPQILIGGRQYMVYAYIEEGEYLVINSSEKTVTKVMNDGTKVNMFDARDKKTSVFQKIAPGRNTVRWSGKFEFYLTLREERGEPKWQ